MKKATGVIRQLDDLGRIIIPKEIRKRLEIKEGQKMEFFIDGGFLVLQKADMRDGDKLPRISNSLSVETPLGLISATPCSDKENPGLWIELYRSDEKAGLSLTLVEYNGEEKEVITRVWGNARSEDYTDKIMHEYIEEYFSDGLVKQDSLMACSISRLAEYLSDNTYRSNSEWHFPDCDFVIIDEDTDLSDLSRVKKTDACGWYGIKAVDSGFNSDALVLVADYYGGNCASLAQIFDGDSGEKEIEKAIIGTLSVQDTVTPDTLLLVEFHTEKSKRDAELEKLWQQFGDIPMDPETECIEAGFMQFPAGTNIADIWHWFDEQHSIGVAYLMGQEVKRL